MCSTLDPGFESMSLVASKRGVEEKCILKWKLECHKEEEWMLGRKEK